MKRTCINTICFCMLLAAALLGSLSISYAADDKLFIDDMDQTLYTSEDGLLSDSTTAITQTDDGFIWIGGYSGLVRFDGNTFDTYETAGLSSISDLESTAEGTLWISSADAGITRYQDGVFTEVTDSKGNGLSDITCMDTDSSDTIWYGSNRGIGTVDAEGKARFVDLPALNGEVIRSIFCDAPSRVLAVTRNGELFCYDGDTAEKIDLGDENGHIRCVAYGRGNGDYLAGTDENRILRINKNLKLTKTITLENINSFNKLICDDQNILYAVADDGVCLWKGGKQRKQNLKMDNSIEDAMIDEEGNFWFVSSRQGVLKVSRSRFGDVSQSAGLPEMVVNAVISDGKRLYAGHDEGFVILDKETYQVVQDEEFDILNGVRIRDLYLDPSGCMWICTKGNGLLAHTKSGEWEHYTSADYPIIASDNFRCIYQSGDELIAGTDEGAYLISHDQVKSLTKDPSELRCRILSVYERNNIFYLGTDGNGLLLVRDGKVIKTMRREDGLSSNVIMKIHPARTRDGLWLVTGKYITYLNADHKAFPIENFLSVNNLDFIDSKDGTVLIPCGKGIRETTEDSLLHDKPVEQILYSMPDGLPYELNANSNQWIDDDVMYLCGAGGIISLDKEEAASKNRDVRLAIDQIDVDGNPVQVDENSTFMLDSDVRRIEIDAHALTYYPEDPYLFYYLEGLEDKPNIVKRSDFNDITYTNLHGNVYTLHFGTVDPETERPIDEITIKLSKRCRWYETPAMPLLAVILLFLVGGVIVRIKTQHDKRVLREQFERQEREHLQEMAYRDYLTGVYNRNYLDVWAQKTLPDAVWPVSFIMLDCNGLKKLNDGQGHQAGDTLLKTVADLINKEFEGTNATIFRVGGDEFLVLAAGLDEAHCRAHMDSLTAEASGHDINGHPISFSYGISTMDKDAFSLDSGFALSDMAMLKAKSEYYRTSGAPDRRRTR